MQVRFGGHRKDTGHGRNNGNGGQAHAVGRSSGVALLYKRLRSRARWPRAWHWREFSKRQRQAALGALGVVVIAVIIALWPARGFEAYGVVTAQELRLSADGDVTVTDCYVRVGDRVKAGDPLYVTVNGDPSGTLAELGEQLDSLRLRLLSLEASEPAAAHELADEAERQAAADAALAATRDALAAMPEAPDLSALLTLQMDCLADLATKLGRNDEATEWQRRADALFGNMNDLLWDEDRFVARHGITGETIRPQSLVPWLAIMLGERLPQAARESLKAGIEQHLTDWGLATERVDSLLYREDGYWQGPIWAPATFIAVTGLDRSGFSDLADTVAERFCRMADKSDFAENYNAITGEPLRCPAYTWTSSVYILLAERLAKR